MTTKTPDIRKLDWIQVSYGFIGLLVGVLAGILVIGVADALKLFVIVVGLFAFAVSITRVDWGLLVLVFITYTRLSDVAVQYHGAPSVAKSFVLLMLFAILARWIVYGEKPEGWQRPTFLVVVYGLAGFASIIYATNPEITQNATSDFIKDGLIVVIVTIILGRSYKLRQVFWALIIAGMFLGSISVIQYVTKTFGNVYWGFAQAPEMHLIGATSGNRISGPFGSPNVYAQIMLVLVPIALDRFWNERNRWLRIVAGYAFVVTTLTVIFTFSRSGFVALVGVLGLLVFFYKPSLPAMLTMILAGVIILQFLPTEYVDRMQTLSLLQPGSSYNPKNEVSYRGRASEFLVGWYMFRDNPILGVGLKNYPIHYQEYSKRVGLDPRTEQRSPHNLYIRPLA
jgi:putative inorganic carbon (hco3(-)) transporter